MKTWLLSPFRVALVFVLGPLVHVLAVPPSNLPTHAFVTRSGPVFGSVVLNVAALADGHGDALAVTAVTQGTRGTVTIVNQATAVQYSPALTFAGTDTFTYTLTNQHFESTQATVTVEDLSRFKGVYVLEVDQFVTSQMPPSTEIISVGNLTVDALGNFTGKANGTVLRGRFGVTGAATIGSPIVVEGSVHLQLGRTNNIPGITGAFVRPISLGSSLTAAVTGTLLGPAGARTGRYTALFKPSGVPQGTGWATVLVRANGLMTIAGRLGDGQIFSTASGLKTDGTFVVAKLVTVPAASGAGNSYNDDIQGTATFENVAGESDFDGSMKWKSELLGAAHPRPRLTYPNGFDTTVELIGSRFTHQTGQRVLTFNSADGSATLSFVDGDFSQMVSSDVKIAVSNQTTLVTPPVKSFAISVSDNPTLGLTGGFFTGRILHPDIGAVRKFTGVIFQKQNLGMGFFRGNQETGTVTLTPQ